MSLSVYTKSFLDLLLDFFFSATASGHDMNSNPNNWQKRPEKWCLPSFSIFAYRDPHESWMNHIFSGLFDA